MIKIENVEVVGFESAIRGMRNPLNSWDKSDSDVGYTMDNFDDCLNDDYINCDDCNGFRIGTNDLNLMQRLRKAGTDHRKYLRMITVYVDITAPLYWWKEFDTYKVGTVANSCSTMHTIHKRPFELSDFSHEHLLSDWNDENGYFIGGEFSLYTPYSLLMITIEGLNAFRESYLKTKDKKYWWQMIQLLPSSYNQKRTVTLNYEVLNNMYHSRKNHKLDEWSKEFVEWIRTLPYSNELIIGENSETNNS